MGLAKRIALLRVEQEAAEARYYPCSPVAIPLPHETLPESARKRKKKNKKRGPKPPGFDWHAYCRSGNKKRRQGRRSRQYMEYLRSGAWRRKRQGALDRAQSQCEVCCGTTHLEVHHVTYVRLGAELPEDLRVVCQSCHGRLHKRAILTPPPNKAVKKMKRDVLEQRFTRAYEASLNANR